MQRSWRVGLLALGAVAVLIVPVPGGAPAGGERSFRIEATSTGFTPAVIRARAGDRVTIELVAMDVVHGLFVDGYELSTTAEPGRPGRLAFVADRTGAFRLRCSVTCGSLHPFVVGVLKVGPQTLLWRAAMLAVIAALGGLWLARR